MKMRAPIVLSLLLAGLLAGPARAQDNAVSAPGWQPTPWADSVFLESQLFFSLNTPDGRGVSEQQWVQFVAEVVAPRFPGGLTVLEAQGLAAAPTPSPSPSPAPAPAAAAAASGGASTSAAPASATSSSPTSSSPTSPAPQTGKGTPAGNGTSASNGASTSNGPTAGTASTAAPAPDPAPAASLSAAAALALSRPGTRLLLIVHPNTPDASAKLGEIKAAYIQRFGQR
ncbi:MAG: hypothetical protein B7Y65_01440, partial [Azorhizobium sp. 35-67-15]